MWYAIPIDYLVWENDDLLSSYADMEALQLVLYESWTASIHNVAKLDGTNKTCFFSTSYNSKWANSASGSRYYAQVRRVIISVCLVLFTVLLESNGRLTIPCMWLV